MTQKIELPKDYNKVFHIGINFFNEEQYEKAIAPLEEAYQMNQSYDIHRLLVICYMEVSNFTHAKELFKEKYHDYVSNHEGRIIYIKLLQHTHEFVTAHMFINDFKEIDQELLEYLPLLQRDEEYLSSYHQEEYVELAKQMKTLSEVSYLEQYQRIKRSLYLPVKQFIHCSLPLLTNPHVHIVIRSSLLENLQRLHCKRRISYLLFNGETVEVMPYELQGILNSKSYVQLEAQIEIELDKQPDMKAILLRELPLIFSVIYPLPEHFIRNTRRFLQAMLYRYGMTAQKENTNLFKEDLHTLNQINRAQCQMYQ